ncbi:MAG: hypothetical protein QOH91_2187, partial [Mycobacterium sp.]|nr:hypothetical protein [Mycobacterium sp.]
MMGADDDAERGDGEQVAQMMTVIFASVAAFALTALTGSSLPTTLIFDVDRRQRS